MENLVEMFDIWQPCKQGEGQMLKMDGTEMKLVARIVNGRIIHLEEDFVLEKRKLTEKESENYHPLTITE